MHIIILFIKRYIGANKKDTRIKIGPTGIEIVGEKEHVTYKDAVNTVNC